MDNILINSGSKSGDFAQRVVLGTKSGDFAQRVVSLNEYVKSNNLNYSAQDIEDLSWNGLQDSNEFKNHFEELSKTNGTTSEVETKAWSQRLSNLSLEFVEKRKKQ